MSARVVALCLLALAAPASAAEITGRVVDASGAPLPFAVVFVDALPPGVSPPSPPGKAMMDQVQKQFVPHVLPVVVGTEVSFPNHDQIHHHVYSFSRTKTFELPLYKGEDADPVVFDRTGAVKVGCNIHDWMSGIILVVPTPYFAMTDESGAFVFRDLPPGKYGILAWHERQKGAPEDVRQEVTAGEATSPLTFTLDVAAPRSQPVRGGPRSYE